MRGEQQLMDRFEPNEPVIVPRATTLKSVLLHVQNDRNLEARLQLALSLARATAAHLSCLHVTPIEAYVTMDSFGGLLVMDKLVERIDDEEAKIRSALESRLAAEDVTWDYEQVTGNTVGQVIRRAALSDIVVTGREAHIGRHPTLEISILGDVLASVRTPLLIAGDDQPTFDPFGAAVIAWNGSFEAANAVRSAVGLLKLARSVHVVQITEEERPGTFPATSLLEYLSRHEIRAELSVIEAGVDIGDQEVISKTIVARAQALDAVYLVMGGYGHSRVGEFIFGGVTRTLLKGCAVPLLIAH
jgi:nucleotide-binding universal stress UspA family protein